jgi:hypothetical protein
MHIKEGRDGAIGSTTFDCHGKKYRELGMDEQYFVAFTTRLLISSTIEVINVQGA